MRTAAIPVPIAIRFPESAMAIILAGQEVEIKQVGNRALRCEGQSFKRRLVVECPFLPSCAPLQVLSEHLRRLADVLLAPGVAEPRGGPYRLLEASVGRHVHPGPLQAVPDVNDRPQLPRKVLPRWL